MPILWHFGLDIKYSDFLQGVLYSFYNLKYCFTYVGFLNPFNPVKGIQTFIQIEIYLLRIVWKLTR